MGRASVQCAEVWSSLQLPGSSPDLGPFTCHPDLTHPVCCRLVSCSINKAIQRQKETMSDEDKLEEAAGKTNVKMTSLNLPTHPPEPDRRVRWMEATMIMNLTDQDQNSTEVQYSDLKNMEITSLYGPTVTENYISLLLLIKFPSFGLKTDKCWRYSSQEIHENTHEISLCSCSHSCLLCLPSCRLHCWVNHLHSVHALCLRTSPQSVFCSCCSRSHHTRYF